MKSVAALTILRDDAFSLRAWLRYYGAQVGLANCHVISAGMPPEIVDMAQGCSIVRLPPDTADVVARKRGRILNNYVAALLQYHAHVIVTDLDELVVVDPGEADGLRSYLDSMPGGQVLTPLGLELIHRVDCEFTPITDRILGPRRHVRPAPEFSRPCVLSTATSLSRNGQFARHKVLNTPAPLYLFKLRYCDKSVSSDAKLFEEFAQMGMQDGFGMSPLRRQMHDSWQKRADSNYWNFEVRDYATQYLLPERFNGVF